MAGEALDNKLKALIAFRVLFVTAILGTFFVFRIGYDIVPYPSAVQRLIIFLYSLTFVYSILLGRVRSTVLAQAQVHLDVLAAVALISFTGGIESWFSSLLILIVLEAAIIIGRRAGYTSAILGGLLYGSLLDLQYYGVLPVPYDQSIIGEREFLYKVFSHITALLLTAYLAGVLTSRLERKDIDLRELSLFNREVIESTPSGLLTTDNEGRIMIFNKAAEAITKTDRSRAFGRHIGEIFPFFGHPEERKRMEEKVTLGGEPKVLGLSISAMYDSSGGKAGFICVFQDLTEMKKLAEEVKKKEKLAAIGELSANMAHEIRNPLASLKGSIEMLKEGTLPKEQKDRLMTIALGEMDRLNLIITDFLDFSRPMPLEPEEFDLNEALNVTMDMLKARANSSAPIEINAGLGGSLTVRADRKKLQQVFLNLGLNALDAMPEGGRLTVSSRAENGMARITFEDTGCGIGEEDIDKVFFPFFTTKREGVGLGLSIAYRIVEEHSGSITIESARGKGTRFDIIIPV